MSTNISDEDKYLAIKILAASLAMFKSARPEITVRPDKKFTTFINAIAAALGVSNEVRDRARLEVKGSGATSPKPKAKALKPKADKPSPRKRRRSEDDEDDEDYGDAGGGEGAWGDVAA